MFLRELTAVAFLCLWNFSYCGLLKLNDYILHYEGLSYDASLVHESHHRVRRSIDTNVHLNFNAHGQKFSLRLRPDSSIFSHDATIEHGDGRVETLDKSHIYQGDVLGLPGSRAVGAIVEGTFRGYIKTPSETYYIEPSRYYFDSPQPFHSIIYADKHVRERAKRSPQSSHCGESDPKVREWMEKIQNSAVYKDNDKDRLKRSANTRTQDGYHNKYTEKLNRNKRATPNSNAKVCTLFMQSDPMLWVQLRGKDKNNPKAPAVVQQEISGIFSTHVAGLKEIYEGTVFSSENAPNKKYTGITFQVNKVKIQDDTDCTTGKNNPLCNPYIDVSNFLNINSLANHDDFCLAYMFTYRDFSQGTLGLAWVGAVGRVSGGICERYKEYNEGGKQTKKSLNTGIVTFQNYQLRVPTKVSILTFAHEVGHNFGSPHDYPAHCMPYTKQKNDAGNYIMFAQATSGDRKNNNEFSTCSRNNITLVLEEVFNQNNAKFNCFTDEGVAFCGNMLVEDNEQCDCGYQDQCKDSCCHARSSNNDKQACTLKTGNKCSSADPCCENCQYASSSKLCFLETSCSNDTYCSGNNKTCPKAGAKPDKTPCNSKTQVCMSGECKDSICERMNGWEECSSTLEEADAAQLCYVSCKKRNDPKAICISSASVKLATEAPEFKQMLDEINKGKPIKKPPGSHCDNMQGYCDAYYKCRRVDADGPLARLKNLLFNPATLNTIKEWIVIHWWAVLLMAIGLILLMALFIKCCAVHTPSSNPNKKPARQFTLPRRRNQQHAERSQPPQPRHQVPQGPPPPYGAPSAPPGGPPPGKGKKRKAKEQKYRGGGEIELQPHHRV